MLALPAVTLTRQGSQSGQITCYEKRTDHVLPTPGRLRLDTGPRLEQPRVRPEARREIYRDDDPDDRATDGAGAEPPHVPPDGEDSRLRETGERALQEREDAGPGASLCRRGGRGGRRVRGAAPRRLHHEHSSRPRSLSGQGRVGEPDVRRAPRQGAGLLSRQGG